MHLLIVSHIQLVLRAIIILDLLVVGGEYVLAAKAPLSAAALEKESSHIITGEVIERTSKVQKSLVEKAVGIHRDKVFTITVRVHSVSKGAGVRASDEVVVEAWQPVTRIPPLPGLQGHRPVPAKGDHITVFASGKRGTAFKPLLPNGIQIHDTRVVKLFGGLDSFVLIAGRTSATVQEAYRIGGSVAPEDGSRDDQNKLYGYPIQSGPIPVDSSSRGALARVLSQPETYLWDIAKGCEFQPGVLLRLGDASTRVDILLCFSCDELVIFRNGRRVGGEDFDPRREDLVQVVKKLFPNDNAIQMLKARE